MSDLLIGERSMGRVSLGMRAGEVQSQYPAPLTRNAVLLQEGYPQAAIEILDTGSAVLMTAELIGDRVLADQDNERTLVDQERPTGGRSVSRRAANVRRAAPHGGRGWTDRRVSPRGCRAPLALHARARVGPEVSD